MTVRVTTLKGSGAGRYYTHDLPSYYLDGDEPPGRWWGKAGDRLGLDGDVQSEAFHALLDGKHPITGANLGRNMGEDSARGFDATFSAPKSVSVLFGLGDDEIRDQVVEAHDAAVNAVLGWIESHAHTRRRVHGHVMCVDTQGIIAAIFRQHTSRRLDPQLHTHAVVASRVLADDGRWLALDARTIKFDQRTLSALYHANLRAELTGRLAVRWQEPKNGIAEIADVPDQVLAEFSQRTGDIDRRLAVKLERFRSDLDRDPSPEELWRLEREAVIDSRPAKLHGTTAEQLREEWRLRTQGLGFDPDRVVSGAVDRQSHLERIDGDRAAWMVDQAVEHLVECQSSWRPAGLVRELASTMPTTVPGRADQVVSWLEELAGYAIESQCVDISRPVPTGVPVRRDGRPITEPGVDRILTTQMILDQEHLLLSWADKRTQESVRRSRRMVLPEGLDADQVEVATAVAQGRNLELVVGPAGAGKTTALKAGVRNLLRQGHLAFGVAPTAAAAEVLATQAGMGADTLDKLLTEHSDPDRPPARRYDLAAGTTIILDEAGTASTAKLAALVSLANEKGWRVVMVGDPRQFSAVGRGGMFSHLVDTHGATELEQVHRFDHEWERRASLGLRKGDPQALDEYDRHGRLHGGSAIEMESQIIGAWWTARQRGETVALMANSNETVARLNQQAQLLREHYGDLDPKARRLRIGDERILVGDEVVTRHNDRHLLTDQGHMVKNRDQWTVTAIHPDRSITVTGRTGIVRLPADYVANEIRLGYAQTSHATQGRTVDTALLLVDTPSYHAGIYTPMTRGRQANHAYVLTEANQSAVDVLVEAIGREWIDQPAIARQFLLERDRRRGEPVDWKELDRMMRDNQKMIERRRIPERQSQDQRLSL